MWGHWDAGVLGCRGAGMQGRWDAGTLGCGDAGMRDPGMQGHWDSPQWPAAAPAEGCWLPQPCKRSQSAVRSVAAAVQGMGTLCHIVPPPKGHSHGPDASLLLAAFSPSPHRAESPSPMSCSAWIPGDRHLTQTWHSRTQSCHSADGNGDHGQAGAGLPVLAIPAVQPGSHFPFQAHSLAADTFPGR